MAPIQIIPQYAIILRYNVKPGIHDSYFRFMIGEIVPSLQAREIYMQDAWHIAYGAYPERQVEFITEQLDSVRQLFNDPQWHTLEDHLKNFVEDYSRRVYRYQGIFKL